MSVVGSSRPVQAQGLRIIDQDLLEIVCGQTETKEQETADQLEILHLVGYLILVRLQPNQN